jgi:hypothetical protein
VILAAHPQQQSNWLEAEILDRAREELSLPVRHVVIDHDVPVEAHRPMDR